MYLEFAEVVERHRLGFKLWLGASSPSFLLFWLVLCNVQVSENHNVSRQLCVGVVVVIRGISHGLAAGRGNVADIDLDGVVNF